MEERWGRNRYANTELDLNNLGYEFMRQGDLEAAILVLRLNAAAYPQSSNVYNSLGEAYLRHGDTRLALENYQKSLQLNPDNAGAAEAIRKLRKSPDWQ